ncbi:MAG: methyltransferase [Vulcanimicrobiota bacterium]
MKAGQIARSISPLFRLEGRIKEDFAVIRQRLEDIGYNEENIFRLLKIPDFFALKFSYKPIYENVYLEEKTPLNIAVKLFLLRGYSTYEDLNILFNEEQIDLLRKVGLLGFEEKCNYACADLYPCLGLFIATDHRFTGAFFSHSVYYLGNDSYSLARSMNKEPVETTLDLCTGSGVQALVASRFSREVTGVDVNSRALNFCRFNALLNQIDNVKFLKGNLYQPVRGRKFDRILSNPPFIPVPDNKILFQGGKETGEYFMEQIVKGLSFHLKPGGWAQFVTLLVDTGEDYNEKVLSWTEDRNFSIFTMTINEADVETYITRVVNQNPDYIKYENELMKWYKNYKKHNIKRVADCLIHMKQNNTGNPIKKMGHYKPFTGDFSEQVKDVFKYLEAFQNAGFKNQLEKKSFKLSPHMDFSWEKNMINSQNQYGVVFDDNSPFMEFFIDKNKKIIIDLLAEGPLSYQALEDKFQMLAEAENPFQDLGFLIQNLIVIPF